MFVFFWSGMLSTLGYCAGSKRQRLPMRMSPGIPPQFGKFRLPMPPVETKAGNVLPDVEL